MSRLPFALSLGLALAWTGILQAQESKFEIKDGDRVALIGDALLERENTYGFLETRLHQQFPDRSFTCVTWLVGRHAGGMVAGVVSTAGKGLER
jgi:hypothetical protein